MEVIGGISSVPSLHNSPNSTISLSTTFIAASHCRRVRLPWDVLPHFSSYDSWITHFSMGVLTFKQIEEGRELVLYMCARVCVNFTIPLNYSIASTSLCSSSSDLKPGTHKQTQSTHSKTVYLVLWFTQQGKTCSEVTNHGGLFQWSHLAFSVVHL